MMLAGIMLVSCSKSEDEKDSQPGSIYGIVTEEGSSVPMKGITIGLYQTVGAHYNKEEGDWDAESVTLLLQTTTFDDGHFEFSDLKPGLYVVDVDAPKGYNGDFAMVTVEAGRQARIDMQIYKNE